MNKYNRANLSSWVVEGKHCQIRHFPSPYVHLPITGSDGQSWPHPFPTNTSETEGVSGAVSSSRRWWRTYGGMELVAAQVQTHTRMTTCSWISRRLRSACLVCLSPRNPCALSGGSWAVSVRHVMLSTSAKTQFELFSWKWHSPSLITLN